MEPLELNMFTRIGVIGDTLFTQQSDLIELSYSLVVLFSCGIPVEHGGS